MEFKEENFAIYQLLVKANMPGFDQMKADFAAAKNGGDEEKYQFAMGIYTVAAAPGLEKALPALTDAIRAATLEQAFLIFEDTGRRDHAGGALMSAWCKANGIGCILDRGAAKTWLDKAEDLAGASDFSRQLRQQISTVKIAFLQKAPKNP